VAECLWCDAPCEGPLCAPCKAANEHPPTYCKKPGHELPTLGPVCAACENEAHTKARRVARNTASLASLRAIRAQHVADFNKPWPGLEHGKALFGMMLDGAISDLEEKP
jgi:hypothetical protein